MESPRSASRLVKHRHSLRRRARWRLRSTLSSIAPLGLGALAATARRLPLWALRPYSHTLAWVGLPLVMLLSGDRGQRSLARVFGDALSPSERRRLMRRAVVNQLVCFIDAMGLAKRADALKAVHADPELVREHVAHMIDPDKGLILMAGHIGAWELLAHLLAQWFPLTSIARRSRNKALNTCVSSIREAGGMTVVYHDDPPRDFIRPLRRGELIALLADNPPKDTASISVCFFDHPTQMSIGPGKLARALGTPVCFVASVRRGNRYHISMDGPHHVSSTDDRDGDIQAFMQLYADFLERTIRENPENWVPFVKSWKRDLRKPATVSANAEHSKSFSAG